MSSPVCPILSGPTASGKTALALDLAESLDLEIINADSLLVYRGFDIGTAKPTHEELARVPHHLIDCCAPEDSFTAAEFVREVKRISDEIHAKGKRVLIVGGTPFYLKALCFGIWDAPPTHPEFRALLEPFSNQELHERLTQQDPARASQIHPQDRYRVVRALEILEFSPKQSHSLIQNAPEHQKPNPLYPLTWIDRDTAELEERITIRSQEMIKLGLIEEVQRLREKHADARALKSVGYQQVLDYLEGILPAGRKIAPGVDGLQAEIILATRQLVKAQRTFLKGLSKTLGADQAKLFILDQERSELETRLRAFYSSTP